MSRTRSFMLTKPSDDVVRAVVASKPTPSSLTIIPMLFRLPSSAPRRGRLRVLDDVLERLLDDTVHAESNRRWKAVGNVVMRELNRQIVCGSEIPAEAPQRGDETELLEFCGVQLVRDPMHFRRNALGLAGEVAHTSGEFGRAGRVLCEPVELHAHQSNGLTEVIVQFPRNPRGVRLPAR